MRIGMMTFHASHNCGSMLQAYALQHTLREKFGHDAVIINFSNPAQRNIYGLWNKKLRPGIIKRNIKLFPYFDLIRQEMKDYNAFSNKYFVLTEKSYKYKSELERIVDDYDLLLAGGDQIWNTRCGDADDAYFLCFANNKAKVAYSPSLGARNINLVEDKNKYRDYLLDFRQISVREPNGKKWLDELTGIDVPIIPDPVMLLTAEEWDSQIPTEVMDEEFIFCYAFSYDDEYNNKIFQQISKKTGLPIYVINSRQWGLNRLDQYGIKLYPHSGPQTYLKLMKNAKIVFSQSFHGTLFASLFEKTFWHFGNRVIKDKDDDRASAMLNQVGLTSRYKTIDELLETDLFEPVDYTQARKNIAEMREKGMQYIKENIF